MLFILKQRQTRASSGPITVPLKYVAFAIAHDIMILFGQVRTGGGQEGTALPITDPRTEYFYFG